MKLGSGWSELKPLSIAQPMGELPGTNQVKVYPVLGQRNVFTDASSTLVKAGQSIAGMVYYHMEVYGSSEWDPIMEDGKPVCRFDVQSVYGHSARFDLRPHEVNFDWLKKIVEGIEAVKG